MTEAILSPEEAILYFQEEHFEGPALAEAFARYPHWQVAVNRPNKQYQPLIHTDEQERLFINLFSKPDYITSYQAGWGETYYAKDFAECAGYYLFKHLPKRIDYLNIDPDTDHGIHYRKGQLKLLHSMGKMVEMDELMARFSQITQGNFELYQEVIQKLREFIFHLVMFPNNQIASAPDVYGHQLVTAFTSRHAALEYIGWFKFNYPKRIMPVLNQVSGELLFSRLVDSSASGVVFNCQGPIRPVTFGRQTCEQFLKR